ncbi:MAG TPA: hypothetical protein VIS78_05135 [Blastocatellia bacterium]
MNRLLWLIFTVALLVACSRPATENPFTYPFIKEIHLERRAATAYSEYRALYVLTEDFEPAVASVAEVDDMRDAMRFAAELSARYQIPWTHFVDVNVLAPAFIAEDARLRQRSQAMIDDLKAMMARGDDCQMHLHGAINERFLDWLRQAEKLHAKASGVETLQPYRQRHSFFFNTFYAEGYRNMVVSLTYGKRLLEKSLYDDRQAVLAFRPGGWDHGSSSQDTRLYCGALLAAGLVANSGLATGNFGGANWRVGNDVGRNLARVTIDDKALIEVSPTAAAGGYVNPVISENIRALAESANNKDTLPVIVSVYHLSGLQKATGNAAEAEAHASPGQDNLQQQREALERHFQLLAELRAQKIIYPITLRELLALIAGPPPADESK